MKLRKFEVEMTATVKVLIPVDAPDKLSAVAKASGIGVGGRTLESIEVPGTRRYRVRVVEQTGEAAKS